MTKSGDRRDDVTRRILGGPADDVRVVGRLHFRAADLRHHERLERRAPGERRAGISSLPRSAAARDGAQGAVEPHLRDRRDRERHPKRRGQCGGKDLKLGASPGQQALKAGLCDEILVHLAPYILGAGVSLFDRLGGPVRLEKISAADGPFATHVRYRVLKGRP